jgi:hypothetical protein
MDGFADLAHGAGFRKCGLGESGHVIRHWRASKQSADFSTDCFAFDDNPSAVANGSAIIFRSLSILRESSGNSDKVIPMKVPARFFRDAKKLGRRQS